MNFWCGWVTGRSSKAPCATPAAAAWKPKNDHVRKKGNINSTYNSETEGERPEASPGMGFDSLPNTHVMLEVLIVDGIVHEVAVGQDLVVVNLDMAAAVGVSLFLLAGRDVGHDEIACLCCSTKYCTLPME